MRSPLAVSGERLLPEMINSGKREYSLRPESPRLSRQPPGGVSGPAGRLERLQKVSHDRIGTVQAVSRRAEPIQAAHVADTCHLGHHSLKWEGCVIANGSPQEPGGCAKVGYGKGFALRGMGATGCNPSSLGWSEILWEVDRVRSGRVGGANNWPTRRRTLVETHRPAPL